MTMLYRTRLYARFSTPLYPFKPFAIYEAGELRNRNGHGSLQYVDPGHGHLPIEFGTGGRWCNSRADGIRAAIVEAEEAAAAIAAILDQLRQELLNDQRHAIAHERPHQPHSPVSTPSSSSRAVGTGADLPT